MMNRKMRLSVKLACVPLIILGINKHVVAALDPAENLPDAPPELTAQQREIWRNGFKAYRTPRSDIGACVTCHSPDVMDLAGFAFSVDDIHRRAEGDGLNRQQRQHIVNLVNLQRERMGIDQPLDPHAYRLLQPGPPGNKTPLNGRTVMQRDLAFARHLRDHVPTLMRGRIDNASEARQALAELLAIDIRNELRSPVPFPLWSADAHHGLNEQFGTIDEWVPSVGCKPTSRQYYILQNAYIENPSVDNFWQFFNEIDETTDCGAFKNAYFRDTGSGGVREIERLKYHMMLMGQHILREELTGAAGFFSEGPHVFAYRMDSRQRTSNPKHTERQANKFFWEIGDFMRFDGRGASGGTAKSLLSHIGYSDLVVNHRTANMDDDLIDDGIQTTWFATHLQLSDTRFSQYSSERPLNLGYATYSIWYAVHASMVAPFVSRHEELKPQNFRHLFPRDEVRERRWLDRGMTREHLELWRTIHTNAEQLKRYITLAWQDNLPAVPSPTIPTPTPAPVPSDHVFDEDFELPDGVNHDALWAIDESSSRHGACRVVNEAFICDRTSGQAVWRTEELNITGGPVRVRLNVNGEGSLDDAGEYLDYLEVAYILDGNRRVIRRITGVPGSNTIQVTNLHGNSLVLEVRVLVSGGGERYRWDNVNISFE